MFKIYFGSVHAALLLSIILWGLTILPLYRRIKKKWLFLLFPLVVLSVPIYYLSFNVSESAVIVLNTFILSYYSWKALRNKINLLDVEIIPIIQMIILLYLTATYRGMCIVAA